MDESDAGIDDGLTGTYPATRRNPMAAWGDHGKYDGKEQDSRKPRWSLMTVRVRFEIVERKESE